MSLEEKVMREESKENSSANGLFLEKELYVFNMGGSKSLENHINEFNKTILELENIEVKVEDEDQTITLLNSLSQSY